MEFAVRVHHRVADTFRANRILLAGDAAHVHSPAGGQGMNLGIEDAVMLAGALSEVLDGAPDTALDDYAADRRRTAQKIVAATGRLTDLATASARKRPLRNRIMRAAGSLPAVRRALAWRLSGLDRR